MSNKKCSTCLYNDTCKSKTLCKHYTSVDDKVIDAELEEYIEDARREFRSEWWGYIDESAEQDFYFF